MKGFKMTVSFYELESKLSKLENEAKYAYDCYHASPDEEALVTILKNFSRFRFENAVAAIWKRNFSILLSFGLTLFWCSPLILLSKIFRIGPKKVKSSENLTACYINEGFVKGKFVKCFILGVIITLLGLSKFAYNVIYSTGWTIVMSLRYLIIPLIRALGGFAIAVAMLIRGNKKFFK
jgi:hypothetical protein